MKWENNYSCMDEVNHSMRIYFLRFCLYDTPIGSILLFLQQFFLQPPLESQLKEIAHVQVDLEKSDSIKYDDISTMEEIISDNKVIQVRGYKVGIVDLI